jgi:hypothetical protein
VGLLLQLYILNKILLKETETDEDKKQWFHFQDNQH